MGGRCRIRPTALPEASRPKRRPNYTIEGKILGRYLKQHFAGQKIDVFYQDDDFGEGGLAGLEAQLPAGMIVAKQPYQSCVTTVGGLLKTISKGKARARRLIEKALFDGYLRRLPAGVQRHVESVDPAVHQDLRDRYDPGVPLDGNVEYGRANAYTLVQALHAAGTNLTRQALVNAVQSHGASWTGPGLVPFRYSKTDHGGFGGAEMGQLRGGKIVLFGGPLTTDPTAGGPITASSAPAATPPANGIPTG